MHFSPGKRRPYPLPFVTLGNKTNFEPALGLRILLQVNIPYTFTVYLFNIWWRGETNKKEKAGSLITIKI